MNEIDDAINPDKKALALRLKGLREKFSWTLSELSQTTAQVDPLGDGVSKVSISRYENGDSYPGYREIKLIAQAFGVSVSYLFYGDVPDPYGGSQELSLDEYLRSVIKEVLIEEGIIDGVSKNDRFRRKRQAQLSIISRLTPVDKAKFDEADRAEEASFQKKHLEELENLAHEVIKPATPKTKKQTKTR